MPPQAGGYWLIDEITSGLRYGFPGAASKIGILSGI